MDLWLTKPCLKTGIQDHIIWPQTKFWQHLRIELKQNLKHSMKVSNHLSDCKNYHVPEVWCFFGGVKLRWVDLRWTLPLIDKALITAKLASTILEYLIWPQTRFLEHLQDRMLL